MTLKKPFRVMRISQISAPVPLVTAREFQTQPLYVEAVRNNTDPSSNEFFDSKPIGLDMEGASVINCLKPATVPWQFKHASIHTYCCNPIHALHITIRRPGSYHIVPYLAPDFFPILLAGHCFSTRLRALGALCFEPDDLVRTSRLSTSIDNGDVTSLLRLLGGVRLPLHIEQRGPGLMLKVDFEDPLPKVINLVLTWNAPSQTLLFDASDVVLTERASEVFRLSALIQFVAAHIDRL